MFLSLALIKNRLYCIPRSLQKWLLHSYSRLLQLSLSFSPLLSLVLFSRDVSVQLCSLMAQSYANATTKPLIRVHLQTYSSSSSLRLRHTALATITLPMVVLS